MLNGKIQFYDSSHAQIKQTLNVKKTEHTLERTKGLLCLPDLAELEGLWIFPCNSIHTFGMKYPLDIIYLDRKNKIKKIINHLKPQRMSFSLLAKSVLEVKAGTAEKLNLSTHHHIKWIQHA